MYVYVVHIMTIDQLIGGLTGSVITASDDDYDAARTFHSGVGAPDLVVRAAGVDDVVAAVRYAAANDIPVAPRGGGHSYWGATPGGMVLDLSALREVTVDGTLVHLGGGAVWGDVAEAIAPLGLAISSGDTASVGVGGLTLSGGVGWMVRCWGLAIDQLEGAQLVTAAGQVLEVSAQRHPELFWALRGGGGNFGVVTRFDFRAHPLPGVVTADLPVGAADLAATLRGWRDVMRQAPEELNVTFLKFPGFGPEMPGATSLVAVYAGDDLAAAEAAIAPLLAVPGVGTGELRAAPYASVLQHHEGPGGEMPPMVDGNGFAPEFDDALVDRVVRAHEASGSAVLMIRYVRGAFNRVAADATAFAHRDAEVYLVSAAFLQPGAPEEEVARVRAIWDEVDDGRFGQYGNFTTTVLPGTLNRLYPGPTLDRLRAVKREWDPGNLFSRNHNVAP